jgi:hypothetical protein
MSKRMARSPSFSPLIRFLKRTRSKNPRNFHRKSPGKAPDSRLDLLDKLVDVTLGMTMRIPMNEYRVTKYNPAFRDESDAYTKSEWTSFKDIGRTYSGVPLTTEEYERVEEAYVKSALSFLSEGGLSSIRVAGLENPRKLRLDFHNERVLQFN